MTEQELHSLLLKHGYAQCWDDLKPTLSQEIRLTTNPAKHDDFRLGSSKLGGKPDLAQFENWPKYKIRNFPGVRNTSKPMTFLMQLNCSDIKPLTSCGVFPETGLLSFFLGVEQNQLVLDSNSAPAGQVIFSNSSHFDLERFEFPRHLYYLNQIAPAGLKMEQSVSVSEEILAELLERYHPNSVHLADDIETVYHREIRRQECHKMFGYPTSEQSHSLPSHDSDWVLLLEFDLEELDILDSGSLCFFIHRDDLNMMDFKNTICLHDNFDDKELF